MAKSLDKNLWSKVLGIKRVLKYSKDINDLTKDEKEIFSYFIQISFLTLKNVNHNVHDGEEGYVSDYSITNFIKCLKSYIDLYSLDILNDTRINSSEFYIFYSKIKEVEKILNIIGFSYEDEFECECFDDNKSYDELTN